MKRHFYLFLMSLFFVLWMHCVYFLGIYLAIYYRLVPLRSVILFTDIARSPAMLASITLCALFLGYQFGKKWWKIIYVDGVYRFHVKREKR